MSKLSILDFVESGEKALKEENYWAALMVALSLPSMCSRVEYMDNSYENKQFWCEKGEKKQWKDKKCYTSFCNSYFTSDVIKNNSETIRVKDGFLTSILGQEYPKVLYDMRCDILHAGIMSACDDGKLILLRLDKTASNIKLRNNQIISVSDLCREIFSYIRKWYVNEGSSKVIPATDFLDTKSSHGDKDWLAGMIKDAKILEQGEEQP